MLRRPTVSEYEISLRDAIFMSLVTGRGLDLLECTDPVAVMRGIVRLAEAAAEELSDDDILGMVLKPGSEAS
jgi:hypothetical protein